MSKEWYEGIICGFDLETTSPDPHEAIPVQIGFHTTMMWKGGEVELNHFSYERIVDPEVEITNSDIHGITTEYAKAHGAPLDQAIDEMVWFIRAIAAARIPFVIYNAAYDWTIVKRYAGGDQSIDDIRLLDPLVIDRAVDRYVKGKGARQLGNTIMRYGLPEPSGELHSAKYDASLTVTLMRAMGRKHDRLKRGSDFAHLQPEWALAQQRSLQAYFDKTPGNTRKVALGWPVQEQHRTDDRVKDAPEYVVKDKM